MSDVPAESLRRRSEPPVPGTVRSFDPPSLASEALDNGLALRLAPRPGLPVVALSLVVEGGEAAVPSDRAGLGLVAGRSLQGGTRMRSGTELAEALEGLGTELHTRTGWDATTLTMTCVSDRLEEAAALLAEVVRFPSFPEGEVARVLEEHGAALRQRQMDPAGVAADAFLPLVYGTGVPYSRPLPGSWETLETFTRERIRTWVEERYRPEGGGLVVAGDVDPDAVRDLVGKHFGDWAGTAPSPAAVAAGAAQRARRVVVVDRPGAVQSELRIGHVGVPRTTPDFHALRVGNAILGGAFTSRLNLNLRERQGFTYGVRSRFAYRRGAGPFSISTAVSTEVTAPAVREAVGEAESLIEDGPTKREVEQAKEYLVGVFPLQFETSRQLAGRAAELLIYGLPEDEHVRFRDRIREVSEEDVHTVLRRHVRPDQFQILVAGDAASVVGPLEELDLGPVEVRSP